MTPSEYKQARQTLGLSVPQWLDALGISQDTHKSYNSGRSPVSPTVERLIKALLTIHKCGCRSD